MHRVDRGTHHRLLPCPGKGVYIHGRNRRAPAHHHRTLAIDEEFPLVTIVGTDPPIDSVAADPPIDNVVADPPIDNVVAVVAADNVVAVPPIDFVVVAQADDDVVARPPFELVDPFVVEETADHVGG